MKLVTVYVTGKNVFVHVRPALCHRDMYGLRIVLSSCLLETAVTV